MSGLRLEGALSVFILATVLAAVNVACEAPKEKQERRAILEHKQGERYDPFQSEPRPARFLRTEFDMKSELDFDVEVFVEEILDRVRLGVIMEEADPGRYAVVVHESGSCGARSELGPPLELGVHEQPEGKAKPADHTLGDIEVHEDGEGKARWLTAWGNLRAQGDETLLNRPVAIYRSSEDGLGELVACNRIQMK